MTEKLGSLLLAVIIGITVGVAMSFVVQWPLHHTQVATPPEITHEQARGRLSALSATVIVARNELRKADDPEFVIPPEKKDEARIVLRRARLAQFEARGFFEHNNFLESFNRATEAIVDAQQAFMLISIWEPTTTP